MHSTDTLESDRMCYLLDIVSTELVDGQRDVVKNERRQGVENAPYGQAQVRLGELLYPKNHPYHWPTIGYMDDLTAASHDDVTDFFKRYYVPANARARRSPETSIRSGPASWWRSGSVMSRRAPSRRPSPRRPLH